MNKLPLVVRCSPLTFPAIAETAGEKTGVNSAVGIAPTNDFVQEAAVSDMFKTPAKRLDQTKWTGKSLR